MPLEHGDLWNPDKDPVPGREGEVVGPLDDEAGHVGGKQDA